ncbi:MAG: cbb3-type cytochrome c oxidase subunit 3 [Sulfitobacter sp.]
MEMYSVLREIADSWVLLAMFAFFVGAGIWAFLPSQRTAREDASLIPFRNDSAKPTCAGTCDTCASKVAGEKLKGFGNV